MLRIGGITVDQTTWSATGPGDTAGVVAPPDVDALAGFLAATGWTVIYGVNMAADQPTAAAAEAAYAAGALGQSLYGFEIGNEPDFYASNGNRAASYTYADFLAQWKTFYAAMHASAPKALFTGPASGGNYTTWTEPFAQDAAADIVLLTQHYYLGNGMSASSTLAELLSPEPVAGHRAPGAHDGRHRQPPRPRLADGRDQLVLQRRRQRRQRRLRHGALGHRLPLCHAQYGAAGVNLHGGGDTPGYTPIADLNSEVVEARPEYYGMLLFTLAGQGEMFATTVTVASVDFTAYAVGPSDGSTNVVLVNKDATQTVRATVDVGEAATTGTTTLLTGPSLASTTGFTIGGVPVDQSTGRWTPVASPAIPVTGTTLVVDVPAGERDAGARALTVTSSASTERQGDPRAARSHRVSPRLFATPGSRPRLSADRSAAWQPAVEVADGI